MEEAELRSHRFSHVGLHFKNRYDSPGPKAYKTWATDDMEADKVLGVGAFHRNTESPYVSLLIDVASTVDGTPEIFCVESDGGKQLSIAIRGLAPSQILSLTGDAATAIDKDFARFIGASRDILQHMNAVSKKLKHSQADLYRINHARYIAKNTPNLIARAEQAIGASSKVDQAFLEKLSMAKTLELKPSHFRDLYLQTRVIEKADESGTPECTETPRKKARRSF